MINRHLVAAGVATLGLSIAASAAAHGLGGYMCQTFNFAKNTPPTTHCITWTKQARARMQAVNCDPKTMSDAEMRKHCAELMATNPPAND